jgi:signal transduction histidine kinase/ActR/RegA family two-component response regulator
LNREHRVESVLVYVMDVTEKVRTEQVRSFLAEASTILNSSLDYQVTLEQVARLAVPELADWCTVHMVEANDTVHQLAVAHIDPAKVKWAKQLAEKYPVDRTAIRGAGLTLRTGVSDLIPEITDAMLVEGAKDPEQLEIYRQVGFKSVMTVALSIQSVVLGVISFIAAESGRRYDQADLRMAEELARRASLAIENARLYRDAQHAQAQAEAANRVKDEFLAVLSHELRSPLNPILGWTKLLQTRPFDEPARKRALGTIERNAQLQGRLIEDLLDISRILNGKMSLNVCSVNLASIIQAALETVRLAAEVKSIQMIPTLNTHIGQVMGDESRLQQVVWNLLSNAVKFTPAGGTITVELVQNGALAQLQVRDTGKGITPDFLPHVFDRFRQANSTTTRQFGGLGLGLAIVRHLVELHGGTVQADSAGEDLGATFTVSLPLMLAPAEPTNDTSPMATTNDLSHIRILFVDDDADMRDLMQVLFSESEAQVFVAASALEALQLFSELAPDILISDIGMPEMDGYSFIEQIRSVAPERGGQIPAIALTAYAGEYNQQKAIAAGFNHHLSKPIEPEHLIQTISKLLSSTTPNLTVPLRSSSPS